MLEETIINNNYKYLTQHLLDIYNELQNNNNNNYKDNILKELSLISNCLYDFILNYYHTNDSKYIINNKDYKGMDVKIPLWGYNEYDLTSEEITLIIKFIKYLLNKFYNKKLLLKLNNEISMRLISKLDNIDSYIKSYNNQKKKYTQENLLIVAKILSKKTNKTAILNDIKKIVVAIKRVNFDKKNIINKHFSLRLKDENNNSIIIPLISNHKNSVPAIQALFILNFLIDILNNDYANPKFFITFKKDLLLKKRLLSEIKILKKKIKKNY